MMFSWCDISISLLRGFDIFPWGPTVLYGSGGDLQVITLHIQPLNSKVNDLSYLFGTLIVVSMANSK